MSMGKSHNACECMWIDDMCVLHTSAVLMVLKRDKIAVANWKLEPAEDETVNKVESRNGLHTNTGLKQENENPDEFIGLALFDVPHGGESLEQMFKQDEPQKKYTFQDWCKLHV